MATFQGKNWNHLRALPTTAGMWASVYRPGDQGETVAILAPDGKRHSVHTPALADWCLAAEDALLTVYYLRIADGGHDFVRVPTTIPCGQLVGHIVTGGVGLTGPVGAPGPQGLPGPAGAAGSDGKDAEVDEATMQRIAALTAQQVLLGGPAGDHYGLPPNAQFGTRVQETIAVMFTNQAFLQEFVKALDEAALGLQSGGYQPKVQGG